MHLNTKELWHPLLAVTQSQEAALASEEALDPTDLFGRREVGTGV